MSTGVYRCRRRRRRRWYGARNPVPNASEGFPVVPGAGGAESQTQLRRGKTRTKRLPMLRPGRGTGGPRSEKVVLVWSPEEGQGSARAGERPGWVREPESQVVDPLDGPETEVLGCRPVGGTGRPLAPRPPRGRSGPRGCGDGRQTKRKQEGSGLKRKHICLEDQSFVIVKSRFLSLHVDRLPSSQSDVSGVGRRVEPGRAGVPVDFRRQKIINIRLN